MSGTDIFGQSREIKTNGILTSDYAVLSMGKESGGGGASGLVQGCQAQYSRRVEPRFELGTSTIHWLTGQSQGSISSSQLIGPNGFLDGIGVEGENCGELRTLNLKLNSNGCVSVSGKSRLTFENSILQSVGFSTNAGDLHIGQNAQFMCAKMSLG